MAPTLDRIVLIDDDGSGLTGTPLNNALFQDLQNRIDALSSTIVSQITADLGARPGDVVILSGPIRTGFLEADGGEYSRATYSALNAVYASVGYPYGAGNGSSTFNTPDLRGRTPIGVGAGPGLSARGLGEKLGTESVTLAEAQIPSHQHPVTDPTHAHGVYDPGHAHTVGDPGHAHAVADPTHAHGITDPTHVHGITENAHTHGAYYYEGATPGQGGATMGTEGPSFPNHNLPSVTGVKVNFAATGVTVNGAPTGIGIYGATTGVTVAGSGSNIGIYGAGTGLTVAAAGGGAAHGNVQPSIGLRFGVKT